jgi:hypothetical protein
MFHAVSHRGVRVLPLQVQMHSGYGQRIPTSVCSWWTQDGPGLAVLMHLYRLEVGVVTQVMKHFSASKIRPMENQHFEVDPVL